MNAPAIVAIPATRVMLALLRVYERDGRATVRTVAAEAGLSVATIHFHLRRLRALGLVTWDDGTQGSLRPAVRRVT